MFCSKTDARMHVWELKKCTIMLLFQICESAGEINNHQVKVCIRVFKILNQGGVYFQR